MLNHEHALKIYFQIVTLACKTRVLFFHIYIFHFYWKAHKLIKTIIVFDPIFNKTFIQKLNTLGILIHLNTGNIWIPNFLKFKFQMVPYSNGQFMCYVLCTRLTIIWIPDQYVRKQDGIHLSDIQMVGLLGIQMAFEFQTIWHPTSSTIQILN